MKAMVIGGAGFIGCNLCEALLDEGHEVVCLDDFSMCERAHISFLEGRKRFGVVEADAADAFALEGAFRETQPEYVFHLAANSDIQASAGNPEVEYRNTYTTTFRVLDAMKRSGVKNLFFASTSAVYGDKRDELLDENTPNLSPVSYYGAAKLGSEALISAFSHMNELNALVFRFPNVIGPCLTHGVIFDFLHKLQKNPKRLEILGDGRQTKPYIHVSDLVGAILMLMEAPRGVSLYNVSVEGATSVSRIADIICEEMGLTEVEYVYSGGESGWKGDVPKFQYCCEKIHTAGWQAKYVSDEAVRMAVRENLEGRAML